MDTDLILPDSVPNIRIYKRRWIVVLVLAVLSLANGMLWISYSPITDHTSVFYNVSEMAVNFLALVFPIAAIALTLPIAWINDVIGLRTTLIIAGWLNCLAGGLRIVSSLNIFQAHSPIPYILVLVGQIVAAICQPLLLINSTKVAAIWFPENQRAIANTIGSMSNPLGILIANLIAPIIVHRGPDLFRLNLIFFVPAALGALIATFGVCSPVPPTPPSESAVDAEVPPGQFFPQICRALRIRPFLLLLLSFGTGMGLFTTFSTLIQQIVCMRGYTDVFAGLLGAILIGVGVVGAGIVGVIVDRTKWFLEVVKFCYSFAILGLLAFSVLQGYDKMNSPILQYLLPVSIGWFGCFGFAMYATSLELGVECTYPVGETVSTGLLFLSGQVFSTVFIVVLSAAAPTANYSNPNCGVVDQQDYKYPVYAMACLGVLVNLVTVLGLNTEYRRERVEHHTREEEFRVQISTGFSGDAPFIST